jgi:hypothetical protein
MTVHQTTAIFDNGSLIITGQACPVSCKGIGVAALARVLEEARLGPAKAFERLLNSWSQLAFVLVKEDNGAPRLVSCNGRRRP